MTVKEVPLPCRSCVTEGLLSAGLASVASAGMVGFYGRRSCQRAAGNPGRWAVYTGLDFLRLGDARAHASCPAHAGAHGVRGAFPGHPDAGSCAVNLGREHCRLAERHLHSCGLHLLRSRHAQLLWEGESCFKDWQCAVNLGWEHCRSPTGICMAVASSSCAAAMLSFSGKVSCQVSMQHVWVSVIQSAQLKA